MVNIDTNSLTSETAASNITSVVVNASGTKKAAPQLVGCRVLITETVTSGSATNVSFTSIPSTFRDLEVRIRGRGTKAATNTLIALRFNADTGANYDYFDDEMNYNGTTNIVGGGASVSATSAKLGAIAASTAPASSADLIIAQIANYRGTTFHKAIVADGGAKIGAANTALYNIMVRAWWKSTAAVTQIDIFPDSNAFVDGTVVSLYGIY